MKQLAILVCFCGFGFGAHAAEDADDPFAMFDQKPTAEEAAKPAPQQQSPKPPASTSRPAANSRALELYCWGNVNRYTGDNVMETMAFEFITVADTAAKSHTAKTVIKGPLLRTGATYSLIPINSQMMVLNAESTRSEISIPTLQLNMQTSALSGSGTVDMSEARGRLSQRLESRGMNTRGSVLLQRGLDSKRRAAVDGYCQAVE